MQLHRPPPKTTLELKNGGRGGEEILPLSQGCLNSSAIAGCPDMRMTKAQCLCGRYHLFTAAYDHQTFDMDIRTFNLGVVRYPSNGKRIANGRCCCCCKRTHSISPNGRSHISAPEKKNDVLQWYHYKYPISVCMLKEIRGSKVYCQ